MLLSIMKLQMVFELLYFYKRSDDNNFYRFRNAGGTFVLIGSH